MLFFSSCGERKLGYGVLLWSIPERSLMDGDVLLVYIKSNISHVWVVSDARREDKKDVSERFEIPLWQMTEPVRYKKAIALSSTFTPYQGKYARVALDALPIRAEATNSAKRVYRLKAGEVVRILGEHTIEDGPMEIPANGGVALEGKWLKVITQEGTQGWCFSHSLNVFDVARGSTVNTEEVQ